MVPFVQEFVEGPPLDDQLRRVFSGQQVLLLQQHVEDLADFLEAVQLQVWRAVQQLQVPLDETDVVVLHDG